MNADFCSYKRVPPDLQPRSPSSGISKPAIRDKPPQLYVGNALYLGRGFQGTLVLITPIPTLIIPAGYSWPYLILNPSRSVGLTSYGDVQTTLTTSVLGNTQGTPIGVANFLNVVLMLEVYSITGTWDFYSQTQNPMSLNWINTQKVFAGITAAGYSYTNIGSYGSDVNFAVAWNPTVAGTINFRLSYVLKYGTGGSASGTSYSVFLGSNNGVNPASGYPVLEGNEKQFILGENVEVWGISYVNVSINVFKL